MPKSPKKFPAALCDWFYAVLCRADVQNVNFSAKLMALNKADALLIDS